MKSTKIYVNFDGYMCDGMMTVNHRLSNKINHFALLN